MFTEPSKSLDIHINKPILSKLNLLQGYLIKVVNYSKIMKKRKLFKQRCARSPTTWLLSSVQLGLEKYSIPPVTKYRLL
jgi:hypothetical protein